MKTEVKKKWLEALRSGEYEQARGYLQINKGYCCLGVLTDLYAKEKGIPFDEAPANDELLHEDVMMWAGIDTKQGIFKVEGEPTKNLADLNDRGVSFTELADIIERHF